MSKPSLEASTSYRALLDVRRVVESLPEEQRKLKKSARRWLDGHSCSADLEMSAVYVEDAIRLHGTKRESLKHAKTALLHMAVIYYARPFDGRSNHRSRINIKSKLSDDGEKFHDLLIDLRHESLAHFGPAGPIIPWSSDYALMVREGGNWQTLSAARRSLYEHSFASNFQDHLSKVCGIAREITIERRDEFERQIFEAWRDSDELHHILHQCEINVEMFGGWSGPLLGGVRSGRTIVEMDNRAHE